VGGFPRGGAERPGSRESTAPGPPVGNGGRSTGTGRGALCERRESGILVNRAVNRGLRLGVEQRECLPFARITSGERGTPTLVVALDARLSAS